MKYNTENRGFTIVELLIVIVVIGILAAITIVAYNGVTSHAKLATLQSDLVNAASQLGIDNVNNGAYPATTADANNGAGLKASPGTTWQYTYTAGTNSYCLTGTNNSVSYYVSSTSNVPTAGACPVVDGSFIQTITSANCPSTRIRTVDARDNHTYWVQKLTDGKCWMLTNLAYAGGGTNTYGDTQTLTNGTGGSATYTVASYYVVPGTTNYTTEPTAPSTSTDGTGQYGYLYNFCGANGGQTGNGACSSSDSTAVTTSISVCPSGWRLPTGPDRTGELFLLNNAVNGGNESGDTGLRTNWFGQYGGDWNAGFGDQSSIGYYWSSTQSSAPYGRLWYFDSTFSLSNLYNKNYGIAVRCVAS